MHRILLSLALLAIWLAIPASTQAYYWETTSPNTTQEWQVQSTAVPASPVGASLQYTLNFTTFGSWDNPTDTKNQNADEWDKFRVQIYRGDVLVADLTKYYDQGLKTDVGYQTITGTLPYAPGVYTFRAWSEVTARDERWAVEEAILQSQSTPAPTPIPGGVWLLGSGLLLLLGGKNFKR